MLSLILCLGIHHLVYLLRLSMSCLLHLGEHKLTLEQATSFHFSWSWRIFEMKWKGIVRFIPMMKADRKTANECNQNMSMCNYILMVNLILTAYLSQICGKEITSGTNKWTTEDKREKFSHNLHFVNESNLRVD